MDHYNTGATQDVDNQSELPFVSIILPVRNEEKFIANCLNAVLQQQYPPEKMEILVADGCSSDRTVEIIRQTAGATRVTVLENRKQKQACGINILIQHAKGDIIIRVDGHTIIAQNYIYSCVQALRESGADMVGGAIAPQGVTSIGEAIACAAKTPFAVPGAFHTAAAAQFTDTVYMGAWKREAITKTGLFNETLRANEDYEYNYRLRKNGGKIYFSPAITSVYYNRQSFGALFRQYFTYGRGKCAMLRQNPTSLRIRQLIAPLFTLWLLPGIFILFLGNIFSLIWLGVTALYIFLALFFAFRAIPRDQPLLIFPAALAFPVMHISWGAGFWRGWLDNIS